MISTSQFRAGLVIVLDGKLYSIIEFQHVKPGKGAAFVRTKLRDFISGDVLSRTFDSGDKFEDAYIEEKKLQSLYKDVHGWHFMDIETYEQLMLSEGQLHEALNFLKEETTLSGLFYQGKLLKVAPPLFVDLKVVHTEPGMKGDTAKAALKPAEVETGFVVQVPLFIENGTVIRIDTRTGQYVGRALKF